MYHFCTIFFLDTDGQRRRYRMRTHYARRRSAHSMRETRIFHAFVAYVSGLCASPGVMRGAHAVGQGGDMPGTEPEWVRQAAGPAHVLQQAAVILGGKTDRAAAVWLV